MICLLIKPWPPSQLMLLLIFTYFIKVCWWSDYCKQHIYGCIFHITTNHLIRINKIVWFASLFDLTIYFSCPIWWNEKVHKCIGFFSTKFNFIFFISIYCIVNDNTKNEMHLNLFVTYDTHNNYMYVL